MDHLEHYGVKGMKWGVRKEEERTGLGTRSSLDYVEPKTRTDKEKQESEVMKGKYGPDSMKESKDHSLTPTQKKLLIALGTAAAVGGAVYLFKKTSDSRELIRLENQILRERAQARYFEQDKANLLDWADDSNLEKLVGPGVMMHWDHGVDLPPGSIVRRMSSELEHDIRPGGFFAAHEPQDVEIYKGLIPQYWPQWGIRKKSGYITELEAQVPIKAPSGKESVDILRHLLDNDEVLKVAGREGHTVLQLSGQERERALDGLARRRFKDFSVHWCNGLDNDPVVRAYMAETKNRGFNALIDFNDAGERARTPMRYLDGSIFKIVGNKPMSEVDIRNAGRNVERLQQAVLQHMMAGQLFLAHIFKEVLNPKPK